MGVMFRISAGLMKATQMSYTTRTDQCMLNLQLHLVAVEVAIEVAEGQLQ